MRLYSGSTQDFIEDAAKRAIADKLRAAFFDYFRYNPSDAEYNAWDNSLSALSDNIRGADLFDHGIILEYQLPLTSLRLDSAIFGRDSAGRDSSIIVELKQWQQCEPSESEHEVVTWLGGAKREVLHPSVQANQYRGYLADTHTAFHEGTDPLALHACSYLHNYRYKHGDAIFAAKFQGLIDAVPVFTAGKETELRAYLREHVGEGGGMRVLDRMEKGGYKPTKKLLDHVGQVIRGRPEYILLDEQLIVFDKVLANVRRGLEDGRKRVVIVRGGPGTGKSVIAINLMASLSVEGFDAQYATGSRAFTETLRKAIGRRGGIQFKYFNSYMEAAPNQIDALIADEAHRIRESSNNRFTKAERRSKRPQIDELVGAAKSCVFFVDDFQVVRPGEIGSSAYIKEAAERLGCEIHEHELEAQFRCNGSDAFVNWVNNTFGIRKTANVIWDRHEEFDFRIFGSPSELEAAIQARIDAGFTARMSAGFCWPWSNPRPDGTLPDDVVIGNYRRPWNAKPEKRKLASNVPPASLWAYDPRGMGQIGCIYTAQGFEFDYVGVIFGPDLVYRFQQQGWVGDKTKSADNVVKRSGDSFVELVKNTYRVLLTRGMKGCYAHFMDAETENFVRSRIEGEIEPMDFPRAAYPTPGYGAHDTPDQS